MTQVLCLESQYIAEDLYALIKALESSKWRSELDSIQERFFALSARLKNALEDVDWGENITLQNLQDRLQSLSMLIKEKFPNPDVKRSELKKDWRAFRKSLVPMYESLAQSLEFQDIHIPSLRSSNYVRNVFHMSSGIIVLLIVQVLLTSQQQQWTAGIFTLVAWCLEFFRRRNPTLNRGLMKIFGKVAHPHESYRVNSATWYTSALFLLALGSSPLATSLAVIVLGFSDPLAAIIG